jgi:hypothetical protein
MRVMDDRRDFLNASVSKCDNGYVISVECNIPLVSDSAGFSEHKIANNESEVITILKNSLGKYETGLAMRDDK